MLWSYNLGWCQSRCILVLRSPIGELKLNQWSRTTGWCQTASYFVTLHVSILGWFPRLLTFSEFWLFFCEKFPFSLNWFLSLLSLMFFWSFATVFDFDRRFFHFKGVQLVFIVVADWVGSDNFICLASSKHNFSIFSWFLLYSPTVLHATMCINRGLFSTVFCVGSAFFSVTIARSFFLITVSFLNGLSIVIVCGEYPVIVPSSMMFHCGASVCRGSLVFLASDLLATFLRVLMYFVVLSPCVKCFSDGMILRVGVEFFCFLASGMFSELSLSELISTGWLFRVLSFDWDICDNSMLSISPPLFLYLISNSSSELPSLLQISSIVRAFCDRIFLSKQLLFNFFYVRLCFDGFVLMLEISMLGFCPKWSSNGLIFVVEFGINLMFSILFAKRFASVTDDQLGSASSTANRLFLFVLIVLPCPSIYGHQLMLRLVFCFFFLQNTSISFALKACAWSHLIERGIPCSLQ